MARLGIVIQDEQKYIFTYKGKDKYYYTLLWAKYNFYKVSSHFIHSTSQVNLGPEEVSAWLD
jgi:hypothetical protein